MSPLPLFCVCTSILLPGVLEQTTKVGSQNDLVSDRLIHYKPKKKKNSTRCWCFIEREDLKPGPQVLELYAKPSDPGRKKKLKLCATLNSRL